MNDRIGAAIDRAFASGGVFVVPTRQVWLLSGDVIYKHTDDEAAARYEKWLTGLTAEKAEAAATLAADWYGTMDDLIIAVETL